MINIPEWVWQSVKVILKSEETKKTIFRAVDKAVPDRSNPIDQKTAEMFKSIWDVVIKAL